MRVFKRISEEDTYPSIQKMIGQELEDTDRPLQVRICGELNACSKKMEGKPPLYHLILRGYALENIPQMVEGIKNDTLNYYKTDFYGRNPLHLALENSLLEPVALALLNKDARLLMQRDNRRFYPDYMVKEDAMLWHTLTSLREIVTSRSEKKKNVCIPLKIKDMTIGGMLTLGEENNTIEKYNEANNVYIHPYFSVSAAEPHTEDKPLYIIKNEKGKLIADDVVSYEYYSCNTHCELIHIKHKDNTQSVFDKNGKPLKDAYRAEKLTVFGSKQLGRFYYYAGTAKRTVLSSKPHDLTPFSYYAGDEKGSTVIHRLYPWKRSFYKHATGAAIVLLPLLLMGACGKKIEELRQENQQNATLVKMEGPVALFDVDGDKKPDYVGKPINAAGQGFLSENVGQTKKIGSWKSTKGVEFIKYQRPPHERQ